MIRVQDQPNRVSVVEEVVEVRVVSAAGPQGPAGPGLPVGGATDDLIVKQSATDYDTVWADEITVDKVTFDTLAAEALTTAGEVAWDFDLETLDVQLNAGVSLHLGQETFYHVKNMTGSTIPKGTVVRAAGTLGNSGRILIAPFVADGSLPSQVCMGVTTESINDGDDGFVTHFGLIRGINLSAFQDFDILYASPTTPGGFTATPPAAPDNKVIVALVIHAVSNGALFVRPTFGSSLADDELVNLAGLASGDTLVYNGTTGVFEPEEIVPAGGTTGQVLTKTSGVDYDSSWSHPAFSWTTQPGEYYGPMVAAQASSATQANRISCIPMFLPRPTPIDRIALRISAGGAAGSLVRLGIYASTANGLPGALLHDFGTVDGTVLGNPAEITVSATLQGFIWLAARFNDNSPTVIVSTAALAWWAPANAGMTLLSAGVLSAVQSSGTVLVDPFPISTAAVGSAVTIVRVRTA